MNRLIPAAFAALSLLAPALRADETPAPAVTEAVEIQEATEADQAAAKAVVESYLGSCVKAVSQKKPAMWESAKKALHPKRLEEIADGKRRTGVEKHALAAWARVGEHYVTKFEVSGTTPGGKGSVVVSTVEDHFSVEEKGHDEGVQAEYLVVRLAGKWFIVDRRLGSGQFPADKAGPSYRGYFEDEYQPPAPARTGKRK